MNDFQTLNNSKGGNEHPRKRDSNIELFRIITMLLIVSHHYVVNSGLTKDGSPLLIAPLSGNSILYLMLGAWGKIGINCFVMITGYFMCKSTITARKFVKLVSEWLFYRYVIHAVFFITGYETFSAKNVVKAVIPITSVQTNFTACFVLFWLCIPFLNILIKGMNERQHIRVLLLMGVVYVLFGTIHQVTMNYVSWFSVIYLISSYIRLYPKKCFENIKLWVVLTLLCILVSSASVIGCAWTGTKINRFAPFFMVTDSNTFLAVVTGICAFMLFKNIHIPYNKVINTIGASTFGVLCIHAHSDSMRRWLWKDTIDCVGHFNAPLYALLCILAVFAVCTVIDIIRINMIEKPLLKLWDKKWDNIYCRFEKKEALIFKKLNVD